MPPSGCRAPLGIRRKRPVDAIESLTRTALGMDGLLLLDQRVQALEDGVDVTRVVAEIEDRVERSRIEPLRDLGIGANEIGEVELLLPGAHGVALDEPVRLVPGKPGVDERQEQALAEEEPAAELEVPAHLLGPDD